MLSVHTVESDSNDNIDNKAYLTAISYNKISIQSIISNPKRRASVLSEFTPDKILKCSDHITIKSRPGTMK